MNKKLKKGGKLEKIDKYKKVSIKLFNTPISFFKSEEENLAPKAS